MKSLLIVLGITSSLLFSSCKNTSENQGYDSGPTTKSERGSVSSEGVKDTTSTNTNVKE